ncbi:MAG: tryptophan--tRNA ligase [Candidatus Vogelbacteria bacterium]|nr:tryptophan--tRNA ligase [Candidatus Vogelbacteria bacterium]
MLSGVKPTGRPHLGNYFGAMRQFVKLAEEHEAFVMIADLHALTTLHNAAELKQNTLDLALDYLAIGLDPAKVTIFKQSEVPAHAELAWIFNTLVTVPYLQRAHAYKDAEAKGKELDAGTFTYPVLMAADILLYSTDIVPVGRDQKQHVEYARDIAEKFNHTYGETFKLPNPLILSDVETVPGIDGQKMSKSYNNIIPLFASDEEITKAVMAIVTDSSGERPENVYQIHKLFKSAGELASLYEDKKGKYKELKEALIDDIKTFTKPLRERREELAKNPEEIIKILQAGSAKARESATIKLTEVKQKVGLDL